MKLRFLGTGTVMPASGGGRSMACIAVHPDEEDAPDFLLDCGHGAPERMAQTGTETGTVGTFLLTHNHMDHNSGIMPVVMGGLLAGRTEYHIFGPEGTKEWWRSACSCYPSIGKAEMGITEMMDGDVKMVEGESGNIYQVKAAAVVHSATALAFRIGPVGDILPNGGNNPAFVYSGDTEPCTGIASLCRPGDLLIHECSFPDLVAEREGGLTNHTHPAALGLWLGEHELKPARIVLTHLYPHCEGHEEEILESLRRHSGMDELDVLIAEDRMEMTV